MNLEIETTDGECKTLSQIEQEFILVGKPVPPGLAQQAAEERYALRRQGKGLPYIVKMNDGR